jgi:hypothetical protein
LKRNEENKKKVRKGKAIQTHSHGVFLVKKESERAVKIYNFVEK